MKVFPSFLFLPFSLPSFIYFLLLSFTASLPPFLFLLLLPLFVAFFLYFLPCCLPSYHLSFLHPLYNFFLACFFRSFLASFLSFFLSFFVAICAAPPGSPHNCTVTAQSQDGMAVTCSPGSTGGLLVTFFAELLIEGAATSPPTLLQNASDSRRPEFNFAGLPKEGSLLVRVYAANSQGRSAHAEVHLPAGLSLLHKPSPTIGEFRLYERRHEMLQLQVRLALRSRPAIAALERFLHCHWGIHDPSDSSLSL